MAVFESHYKELGFYANGEFKKFKNGRYVTDNKNEIATLEKLTDTKRVDKTEAKAEAPKKAPAKKSTKSSAK
jgi:hypothetical protein